jgi:hypothetical protein
MASSSIPSSSPATGPISIRSLSRSKRSSSRALHPQISHSAFGVPCQSGSDRSTFGVISFGGASSREPGSGGIAGALPSIFRLNRSCGSNCNNAQRPTLNPQRSILRVGRWTLDVERWTFSSSCFRRVKGAWWPSRSSKPSLVGNGRDRFDSYPLRHFMFVVAAPLCRGVCAHGDTAPWLHPKKGGD